MPTSKLAEQMSYLAENHEVLSMDELVSYLECEPDGDSNISDYLCLGNSSVSAGSDKMVYKGIFCINICRFEMRYKVVIDNQTKPV